MIRTFTLLVALTILFLGVGFVLGGIFGMTVALVLVFVMNFFTYWYSDRIILRMYKAYLTEDEGLREMVRKLANEASIPVPKLYVVPSDIPNAFATGRNPEHGAVAVTRGLMKLTRSEMESVIAHEITHIKNRDTLIQSIAATIAGAI
ncbi:MAG: M48 family metalloprotease, partial [Candidatus Aenigmatarchaeota archaeon]